MHRKLLNNAKKSRFKSSKAPKIIFQTHKGDKICRYNRDHCWLELSRFDIHYKHICRHAWSTLSAKNIYFFLLNSIFIVFIIFPLQKIVLLIYKPSLFFILKIFFISHDILKNLALLPAKRSWTVWRISTKTTLWS